MIFSGWDWALNLNSSTIFLSLVFLSNYSLIKVVIALCLIENPKTLWFDRHSEMLCTNEEMK